MEEMHCPKCGAGLGPRFASLKMASCPYCGTTSFLEDGAFRAAGSSGVMHAGPALIALGTPLRIGGTLYLPRGQARFGYGRGEWDEFWAEAEDGTGAWISVDEGDVVIQRALAPGAAPGVPRDLPLGTKIQAAGETFTVTEAETAECLALRGLFPEVLRLGERYRFVDCADTTGRLLSGERGPDGWLWFLGNWFDPFEVTPA